MATTPDRLMSNRYRTPPSDDPTDPNSPNYDPTLASAYSGGGSISPAPPASNPVAQGVPNQYGGTFDANNDPSKQMGQNRMKWAGQGDAINTELTNQISGYGNLAEGYRNQADSAYGGLQAQSGYTPGQEGQINVDYSKYQTDPNALQQRQLTSDEQSGIAGDPSAGFNARDPSGILDATNQGNANLETATTGLQLGLKGSYDPSQVNESGTYGDTASKVVTGETGKLDTANTAAGLSLDPAFAGRYRMTPQQQQDIVTAAGTTVGNAAQTQKDDIARRAAAEGNTSPAALAAMEARIQNQAEATAGDSMTNARIAASNAAAQREQTLQGMELGSAQDIASRQAQAAETESSQFMDAAKANELMRMSGAKTVADLGLTAANIGGQAGINTAGKEQQMDVNAAALNQQTAVGQTDLAEQEAAARAAALAANRQGTTADIQNTEYGQGMQTGAATSGGAQTTGNAQIAGMNSYRNYLTGQQGAAQTGATTATGQQIQNMGTQGNLVNTASGQKSSQDQASSAADQGWVNTGLNALKLKGGGVVEKPGLYQIGESGPEMVIKLGDKPGASRYRDSPRYSAGGVVPNPSAGLPRFADGGIIRKPTLGVIGEEGPEARIPLQTDAPDPFYGQNQDSGLSQDDGLGTDTNQSVTPDPNALHTGQSIQPSDPVANPNAATDGTDTDTIPDPASQIQAPRLFARRPGSQPLQTDAQTPPQQPQMPPTMFSRPYDSSGNPVQPSQNATANQAVSSVQNNQAQPQPVTSPGSQGTGQPQNPNQSTLPISGSINFGGSGNQSQPSMYRAQAGGVFDKPTPAIVGEDGPEQVIPLDNPDPTKDNPFTKASKFFKSSQSGVSPVGQAITTGVNKVTGSGYDPNKYLVPQAISSGLKALGRRYGARDNSGISGGGIPNPTEDAEISGGGQPMDMYASGGIVDKPTIAMLADKGPEMVVPLTPRPNQKVTPGMMPQKISQVPVSTKSRYRTPIGVSGNHPPLRNNLPLVPNRLQR